MKFLNFFKNKIVLITGHTGFKGSWLTSILLTLGSKVIGVSLETKKGSHFDLLKLKRKIIDIRCDIRNEKKLNKTEIIAPYAGRIQKANIDIGTTIIPGQPIGAMYTSSEIEVTLSVKDNDLQFLSIPMDGRKLNQNEQAKVVINSFYKGKNQNWEGKLERVDGVIDPITRMVNLIAVFIPKITASP